MKRSVMLVLLAIQSLAGCANFAEPIPASYSGPTALVMDWGGETHGQRTEFYVLKAIDAQEIRTTIDASRALSAARNFLLQVVPVERQVPARPMKATLLATHYWPSPVSEWSAQNRGEFLQVSGVVDFTPQPGRTYVVKATLTSSLSQVWIEEEDTKVRVTEIVSSSRH